MIESMPEAVVYVVVIALLVAITEAGYRLGRRIQHRMTDEQKGHLDAIMAGLLGLLGLLLAFAFGLSASRFDTRKQLVLDEANAIGTAYLRAQALPAPARADVRSLLRAYTDLRVMAARRSIPEKELAEAEAIQQQLWSRAATLSSEAPAPFRTGCSWNRSTG
jgi:hypothetical protein